jgi:hypothetical protein
MIPRPKLLTKAKHPPRLDETVVILVKIARNFGPVFLTFVDIQILSKCQTHNGKMTKTIIGVRLNLMAAEGSIPGGNRQRREADHSSPPSAEVKNGGGVLQLPHMPPLHSS